ncbi:RNA pseudouridylate synthase domain-containing protein 3-like [Limulus polyphemus]|uniref:Pseudouridylate synthase RPUSD4, mitochondrial n=1 Tax=Limulus polyphemus TaxID=6850 RepID=A0ABM1SGE6_LIMPO|nr:RNA pseudouridylate synthase domain-containing protein 3-like [Limulus polyphemus]XP_022242701.1 RNA pseudouridylate synthase domain-containing protein 3-like [Limulus polyphemus]
MWTPIKLQKNVLCKFLWNTQRCISVKRNKLKDAEGCITSLPSNHCYTNLYPWKHKDEFIEYMVKSIVYNNDGLIVVNKPYGVPIYKHNVQANENKSTVTQTVLSSSQVECPYVLEDALEALKSHLQYTDLKIVKSAERYMSGIVLLAATEKVAQKIRKAITSSKTRKQPFMNYWAITKGYPDPAILEERVGIKLIEVGQESNKQPIIVKKFSKKEVLNTKVRPVNVEFRTICINKPLSSCLLEITTSSVKWHFLRVYLANKVSCVLGDTLYSSRVRQILGQPFTISPYNTAAYDIQSLPNEVCSRLKIPTGIKGHTLVPVMLHHQSFLLPDFVSKGQDLLISALPPSHFLWTCSQLDILPESNLMVECSVT